MKRLTDGQTESGGWRSKAFPKHGEHQLYPEFVTLDLGTNCSVKRVVLCPVEGGKGFPVDFSIQVCREGEPWRTVLSRKDYEAAASDQSFDVSGAEGRFVKVEATRLRQAADGAYRFQLAELEIWGEPKAAAALEESAMGERSKEAKPDRLRCENRDNPEGMDEKTPRFSWWMRSSQRGDLQTAYRILVASTEDALKSGKGDLWDSGQVNSDQTIAVRYAGKPLRSAERYFWKLTLWDKAGKQSPWSDQAWFVTGKLSESDWRGKWIGANAVRKNPHGAVYLRKEIAVNKPVRRATVFFSGLGWSELAVDGHLIDNTLMAPGFTTYDKRTQYLVRDVTRLLSPGKHTLDVTLLDGWYALEKDVTGHGFERRPYIDHPKLLLDLHLKHPDGTETVIASDETWQWSEGPITRSWLCEAEEDWRIEPGSNGWSPVAIVRGPAGRLVVQKEYPTHQRETLRPISLEQVGDAWVYRFDREFTGFVKFRTRGPRGTEIQIATKGIREGRGSHDSRERNFRCVLRGEGVEEFAPRNTYAGIARATVRGVAQPPTLDDLVGCRVSGVGPVSGDFRCSNDLLNWLHDAIRRTQSNYVTYLPNDNSREYKAWTQDIENMFRSAVYLFDSQAMYERWQHDMLDVQAPDGNLANVAPGPVYDPFNSPWWGGCAVWLPWYWYLQYGDASLLEESYPAMKRYVDFLARQSPSGIQDWGLSDWYSFRDAGRPVVNTPAAIFFARVVSRTAAMMGRAEEARHYAELSERIKRAFNAGYLDTKRGVYGRPRNRYEGPSWPVTQTKGAQIKDPDDLLPLEERPCTQGGQVLPLMLGVVPDEHRQKAEDALRAQIKADRNLLTTGFVGTPYLLAWLGEHAPETAWALTTTHEFPSWYRMSVGSDSDQMMETWDGGMVVMPSLGGNLVEWNMESLAGIRPDPAGPGFKKIIIKPNLVGDLHWAEGWYDSVRGRIESKWRKRGEEVQLDVIIPANCSATVYMPAPSVEAVTESANTVKKAEGVRFLRSEKGYAVFQVGSGRYFFESKTEREARK